MPWELAKRSSDSRVSMIIHGCSLRLLGAYPRHVRGGRRARMTCGSQARGTVRPHNPWQSCTLPTQSQARAAMCPHNPWLADHMYTHEHTLAHMSSLTLRISPQITTIHPSRTHHPMATHVTPYPTPGC